MTKLNDIGVRLGENPSVHALTDVSGFGLLGHLNEMCRGAQLAVDLRVADVPVMHALTHLFEQLINGPRTNAAKDKNNDRLIDKPSGSAQRALKNIKLQGAKSLPPWQLNTLADPQTSGGLLIACDAGAAGEIVSLLHTQGFERAQVIGQFRAGDAIHIHA